MNPSDADTDAATDRDREGGDASPSGEYDRTPSFYTSDDTFERYLGQTSHYLALQDALVELVGYIDPDGILEPGSGLGQTAIRLADEYPATDVHGIDNRESVVERSRTAAEDPSVRPNLTFSTAEMRAYVESADSLPDLVAFLHSFHHIPDPLSEKIDFLEACHAALPDGGHICIGETFLRADPRNGAADRAVRTQWADRALESYASTFWSSLDGVTPDDIERARSVGVFSQDHESAAGENVRNRDEEYLVTMDWLVENARSVGFEVVLAEPVNSLGDGVVLLRR